MSFLFFLYIYQYPYDLQVKFSLNEGRLEFQDKIQITMVGIFKMLHPNLDRFGNKVAFEKKLNIQDGLQDSNPKKLNEIAKKVRTLGAGCANAKHFAGIERGHGSLPVNPIAFFVVQAFYCCGRTKDQ
jgi:hypothetical protein